MHPVGEKSKASQRTNLELDGDLQCTVKNSLFVLLHAFQLIINCLLYLFRCVFSFSTPYTSTNSSFVFFHRCFTYNSVLFFGARSHSLKSFTFAEHIPNRKHIHP